MSHTNDTNCAVKIAVRERPFRNESKDETQSSVIMYHPNGKNIVVNETLFTFDHVLGPSITQKEIFDNLVKPSIAHLKQGFNCTALAYGQTGTGKSYTMGLNSMNFNADDVGVIPRCLKEIFSMICAPENEENKTSEISISFIEIYNEKVYDLFAENTTQPIAAKGYKYTGGIRKSINSLEECYALLMQGNKNRHVRPTKMNSQSSRSHAIFTIHVRSRIQQGNGEVSITTSCMNIVDLAGSEGVRRTGHQGVAMSEGVHINQGLLSIGKVLQAITAGSKLIPYRDSVLSSVLQESLNANSYLTLLACISPHPEDLSETLSTLRFAQNAKLLKNVPQINNIITDIKQNAKLKQTPYKVKPMQMNSTKHNPLKRTYSTLYGTQAKSSIKSHTFCTPKKKKMEINKCNQTEVPRNDERLKLLTNGAINLSKTNQLDSTHNRESIFTKSLDSNGSLLSLNISTSTALDGDANKRSTNFSPFIRKYMTELKYDLENNLLKIFQKNLQTFASQTSTPAPGSNNETVLPSTIRQELKNIMKEVLSEQNSATTNNKHHQANQSREIILKSPHTNRQLFDKSNELFKVPEIPLEFYGPKTSSPINNAHNVANTSANFTQTFFPGVTNTSENTVLNLNQSVRRSYRIAEKQQQHEHSSNDDSVLKNSNQSLRRSVRQSVLQQKRRESIRLSLRNKSLNVLKEDKYTKATKSHKKLNKAVKVNLLNNTMIDNYCHGSSITNSKTSLGKHRKAILDLLNKGSMKELQILPQVGQKTAYQIVTHRIHTGKFKSLVQVEKLPFWRGTAWERFAKANMLL